MSTMVSITDGWFADKDLTFDWTSQNFTTWLTLLDRYKKDCRTILEIGSFEGRSTIFFLEYFRDATITCVDTFSGGTAEQNQLVWANLNAPGGDSWKNVLARSEERFDKNVSAYGARVEKLKSPSVPALCSLAAQNRIFDLVYVDGSHFRADVFIDSLLAWKLTKPGSLLIWDDYEWELHRDSKDRPKEAIDTFLSWYSAELEVLHRGYQVVIRRTEA